MSFLLQKIQDSSVINFVAYDTTESTLVVEFNSKSVWIYLDVDIEHYYSLISADSVGNYFNKNIRNKYESYKYTSIENSNYLESS